MPDVGTDDPKVGWAWTLIPLGVLLLVVAAICGFAGYIVLIGPRCEWECNSEFPLHLLWWGGGWLAAVLGIAAIAYGAKRHGDS